MLTASDLGLSHGQIICEIREGLASVSNFVGCNLQLMVSFPDGSYYSSLSTARDFAFLMRTRKKNGGKFLSDIQWDKFTAD